MQCKIKNLFFFFFSIYQKICSDANSDVFEGQNRDKKTETGDTQNEKTGRLCELVRV